MSEIIAESRAVKVSSPTSEAQELPGLWVNWRNGFILRSVSNTLGPTNQEDQGHWRKSHAEVAR